MIIAWDFDGVLNANHDGTRYVWEDAFRAAYGQTAAQFGRHVFGARPLVITGEIDLLDRLAEWIAATGIDITPRQMMDEWLVMDARLDAEMIGLVERLGRAGVRQVIATNNEAHRTAYIANQMGMAARVAQVFASGHIGIAKPDAGYYQHITAALGVDPSEMLMIDDKLENVDAAMALGWDGYHFTPDTRAGLIARLTEMIAPEH